jgi:pimeloyl-ACP methyl ester carboxylesterase
VPRRGHTDGMNPVDLKTVSSSDGTRIAYDQQGAGPALILVDGALTVHSSRSGSELARLLAPHFTVYGFDRRGPMRWTGRSTTSRP